MSQLRLEMRAKQLLLAAALGAACQAGHQAASAPGRTGRAADVPVAAATPGPPPLSHWSGAGLAAPRPDSEGRELGLPALTALRRAAGRGAGAVPAAEFPDLKVESVRLVSPSGPTEAQLSPPLRIVELRLMHLGLPVRGAVVVAYFAGDSLRGVRGRWIPRSSFAEAFRGVDASKAMDLERVWRLIGKPAEPAGIRRDGAAEPKLVWDLDRRRLLYVAWDEELRTEIDALSGEILVRTRFGPVPGWEPWDRATITGLSLAHRPPVELDWPLETVLGALEDFPNQLIDRRITGWLQLMSGWVPRDCEFRLSYGAGEGLESVFPFPSLYPGDSFERVETRAAACFAHPFTVRPAASDPDPVATRRALAYQNAYLHGMLSARHAAWNRAASVYTFLEARQRLTLHIKALPPEANQAPGCGSYACYVAGTHTIRIVDDILFAGLLLHEYGHYVHHTYQPDSFPQASCLVRATQEGVADGARESLLGLLHGDAASDAWFLGGAFPTARRGDVKLAIGAPEECSANAYGDGKAIGQILQALMNDRVCAFDSAPGDAAPCQVQRILGDARGGAEHVPRWGREAFTHAQMYTGTWSTAAAPASPHEFVESMAYWFRVLSEVYGLLQPAEWDRVRRLFLSHGVDPGPYQP